MNCSDDVNIVNKPEKQDYSFLITADKAIELYNNSANKAIEVLKTANTIITANANRGKRTAEFFCPSEDLFTIVKEGLASSNLTVVRTIRLNQGFNIIVSW